MPRDHTVSRFGMGGRKARAAANGIKPNPSIGASGKIACPTSSCEKFMIGYSGWLTTSRPATNTAAAGRAHIATLAAVSARVHPLRRTKSNPSITAGISASPTCRSSGASTSKPTHTQRHFP